MVQDANAAFQWLRENIHHETTVVVWGHEIGAAIAANLGANIKGTSIRMKNGKHTWTHAKSTLTLHVYKYCGNFTHLQIILIFTGECNTHPVPNAYVLESPFTSAKDYISQDRTCLAKIMSTFVGSGDQLKSDLKDAFIAFDTEQWIQHIECKPLFILHAEDDEKVSFEHGGGKQLFQNCHTTHTSVEHKKSFQGNHTFKCMIP